MRMGDLKISYVPDGAMLLKPADPPPLMPRWNGCGSYLNDTGMLVANTGALLVESGPRALLIDAGFGPYSVPEDAAHPYQGAVHGGLLPGNLDLLGRSPTDIDTVAFTHLRPDRFGWAGVEPPLFTRATFVIPKNEGSCQPPSAANMASHVGPLPADYEIFPGVRALFLPGDELGRTGFHIASRGTRLLAFGDALTSPLQIQHPQWSGTYDTHSIQTERHRRHLITELTRPDTLGFGLRFADVVFGRARPHGQGAAWLPL
ncbi:hypothetical protein AMK30_32585 [Streptomyces sp. CB02460]|nr:hypothetical protein AMK30_32585 [Streptomyces sp. CB02460]